MIVYLYFKDKKNCENCEKIYVFFLNVKCFLKNVWGYPYLHPYEICTTNVFLICLVYFQNCAAMKKQKKDTMVSKHTLVQISLYPWLNGQYMLPYYRLVYPMLPVSLDCPFFIVPSVFPNIY
jgi:hypothetical protein